MVLSRVLILNGCRMIWFMLVMWSFLVCVWLYCVIIMVMVVLVGEGVWLECSCLIRFRFWLLLLSVSSRLLKVFCCSIFCVVLRFGVFWIFVSFVLCVVSVMVWWIMVFGLRSRKFFFLFCCVYVCFCFSSLLMVRLCKVLRMVRLVVLILCGLVLIM